MDLSSWITNNLFSNGKLNATRCSTHDKSWLNLNFPNKLKEIITKTSFLPEESKLVLRIFCIQNNIKAIPTCKCSLHVANPCTNKVSIHKHMRFLDFCCKTCANRFNVKTGTEAHIASEAVQKKIKESLTKKYGVDNVFKLQDVQDRIRESNLEKYGGQPICAPGIKEKIKQTMLKTHGAEYYSQTATWRELIVKSNQKHLDPHSIKLSYDIEWLKEQHNILGKPLTQIAKELNLNFTTIWERFREFNIPIIKTQSTLEADIQRFINENYSGKKEFNIYGIIGQKELDVFLPEISLAIEANGIFWHSSKFLDKSYHKNKTDLCEAQGISLLHIYEDEWNNSPEIWKSIILNKINKNGFTKINGRQCIIDNVPKDLKNRFLEENHLQGKCASTVNLGLFHKNNLVSLMTFSKSRYSNAHEWELIRFCSKLKHTVHGAGSKLFKYFITNYHPKSIVSYADRRYSKGEIYKNLGFTHTHTTPENYCYVIGEQTYSRQSFQKKKLAKKLEVFDCNLTELENTEANGIYRLYNSGQMVWVWEEGKQLILA